MGWGGWVGGGWVMMLLGGACASLSRSAPPRRAARGWGWGGWVGGGWVMMLLGGRWNQRCCGGWMGGWANATGGVHPMLPPHPYPRPSNDTTASPPLPPHHTPLTSPTRRPPLAQRAAAADASEWSAGAIHVSNSEHGDYTVVSGGVCVVSGGVCVMSAGCVRTARAVVVFGGEDGGAGGATTHPPTHPHPAPHHLAIHPSIHPHPAHTHAHAHAHAHTHTHCPPACLLGHHPGASPHPRLPFGDCIWCGVCVFVCCGWVGGFVGGWVGGWVGLWVYG